MASHLRTKRTLSYIKLYLHVMFGFLQNLHFLLDPPSGLPLLLLFLFSFFLRVISTKVTKYRPLIRQATKTSPVKIVYQNDTPISCVFNLQPRWNERKKKKKQHRSKSSINTLPPASLIQCTIHYFIFVQASHSFTCRCKYSVGKINETVCGPFILNSKRLLCSTYSRFHRSHS